MNMDRKLIVTADDYGLCDSANEAIEACLEAGTMRSTCVMTNMPVYQSAAGLRPRFPDMSVGIHWTLTEGRPVLAASEVPSLVDAEGRFYSRAGFRRKWLANQVKRSELRAELRAQFRRLCDIAGLPEFWNTHQDIHMLPGLYQTCVSLGLELGIPAMRSHRRILAFRDTVSRRYYLRRPLFWIKGFVIDRWAQRAETQGMRMPDGKVYIQDYGPSRTGIEEAVKRLPWNSIGRAAELIIHPVTAIDERVMHALREVRLREYQVFADRGLADGLHKLGIQITGFGGLEYEQ
jgi:predicted glycoside hydrolase/deacetylase ChbG (UPF0249 family)